MDDYFHGKLDRRTAEERLSAFGRHGSYLIRESDRKTGAFVLSFLGKTGLNHFCITRGYGSYFIGGRKFDSILELIEYYNQNDLLTGEQLVHPVNPPEPVSKKCRVFVSILPYTGLGQDELSFKKDTLFIHEHDHDADWYWCRDVKTGAIGLVFSHLIEEVVDDIDPNEVFSWFHSNLSKSNAVDKLAKVGPGSFLVKPSESSQGNYTLYYNAGVTVQRFQIIRTNDNRYVMGGRCFDSLGQIIDLYQEEQIIEGHTLKYPVNATLSRADHLSEQTLSNSMRGLNVREKPEDIYNTVKQSRESARSKELRGWLSLKKGDISKKWKRYYFILNPATRHLYYYEKPQQAKPKGLIDLCYSYIHTVHESMFDWAQCFQIVEKSLPCFASFFYLQCGEDSDEYNQWICAIKRFTLNNQDPSRRLLNHPLEIMTDSDLKDDQDKKEKAKFMEKRGIKLELIEAHSLKVQQPQFVILFNQEVMVARTKTKSSPVANFEGDESRYEFLNVPAVVSNLTIALYQSSRKSKATLAAECTINLHNVEVNQTIDHWCELRSIKNQEIYGWLRLRLLFKRDIIMRYDQYAALEELVSDPELELINFFEAYPNTDLSRAIVNILVNKRCATTVLKTMIEKEVASYNEIDLVFSRGTLTTIMLESFIRLSCQKVLTECLKSPVRHLLEIGEDSSQQNACDNLQKLFNVLEEMIQNIYNSALSYPKSIRYLFAILQRSVQLKWPKEPLIRTRVVSGFLFLRLICPTIIKPKQFGLISKNQATSADQKQFALVAAKCLQNLANIVDADSKPNSLAESIVSTLDNYSQSVDTMRIYGGEDYAQTDSIMKFILSTQIDEWMEVLQPVILKNKLGLVKFIDEICNVELCDPTFIDQSSGDLNNNSNPTIYDSDINPLAEDLAMIHSVCEFHLTDLEQSTNSSPIFKRLVTTVNILTQRRLHYAKVKKNASTECQIPTTNV